ncbi:MAG: nuclear transport factor 2 family protein [Sphingomonadales bacterium]|nr:nuclear transport factor 2 family protein [Sphingomonadales bacterium]
MTPLEVALGYIAAFSSGDPDQVADRVTADFANNQMGVLGSRFAGRDLYRTRLAGFLKQFEGISYTVASPIVQGNVVAAPYVMTASDAGRPLRIEGVMMITVEGDLVAQRDDYWDGLTYFRQIGVDLPL